MLGSEFDVAVVGGGPGGSAAAKKCAEAGLTTVLLEKHKLPRNKVCTGMIMSQMAQTLIKEEFGEFPQGVLTSPPYINGLMFHMPGTRSRAVEHKMPLAWRKDLDYWMNQKAEEGGAEIYASTRVAGFNEDDDRYTVKLEREGDLEEIKTRFVIGADGTTSVVREALFPDLKMRYYPCMQECYQAELDLDTNYVHYFYFPDLVNLGAHQKGEAFLIESGVTMGEEPSEVLLRAKELLAQEHGFDLSLKPLWRDGCVEPLFHRELSSGSFSPAKGNILLIGNAAGLVKPVTGEGIGTAIKSGLLAADAVIKAAGTGRKAANLYLEGIKDMLSTLGEMYPPRGKLREEAARGSDYLLESYKELYDESFRIL